MILEIDADHPNPRDIRRVVEDVDDDGVVAYPTDTVYGVGCSVERPGAIKRLRRLVTEIKGEPDHAPLSFICDSLSQISEYAHVDDQAYRLMRSLLPGPFTFILRAKRHIPAVMRKHRETVGVRVPEHAIPQAIVDQLGSPVVTTSAVTEEGDLIPDPWTLEDLFGHVLDLVIDGGYVEPASSTVLDLSGETPELVREGKGDVENQRGIEIL